MMRERTLFISPHNDDETLFAAYTLLRYRPYLVTVLESDLQERYGITGPRRERESYNAYEQLGVLEWEQWRGRGYRDSAPEWRTIEHRLGQLQSDLHFDRVFAPAIETGGHEQHTAIGKIAARLFPQPGVLTHYTTYIRGQARTVGREEVVPEERWPAAKLAAMACYESQINLDMTRPWFSDWDREWYA